MIGRSICLSGGGSSHGLFDAIISPENLLGAWREFRKGKTKKKDVLEFEFHLERNIFELHDALKNRTYGNKPYEAFYVYDPKKRHIHKAHVRDRVVHQALYRKLYSLYDPGFIHDSYSCRIGKGTHRGVLRLRDFIRKEGHNDTRTAWVLKCDIRKFFDSIDHVLLQKILYKKNIDEGTGWLIKNIISSFEKEKGKGLPLGNVTSQLFGNVYLNEFDQFIKHRLKATYYARYCDDFVIISHTREFLERSIPAIARFLRASLLLELHPRKVDIRKARQGIDFLGYVVFPHYMIVRTSTKKRILKNIRKGVSEEAKQSYLGILSHCKGHTVATMIETEHEKRKQG